MKVDILGADYLVIKKEYKDDEAFERRSIDGYCNSYTKQIVICDMSTYKGWEHEDQETVEACEKHTLRHEIVHAFLAESGLKGSEFAFDGGWAENEEMIDWIAAQGIRIFEAWNEVGAV